MRRPWLPVCALLALGCSTDPSPTDTGTDAPVSRDDGADVAATDAPDVAQLPDVADAGGVDVVDAPAPVDAPDVPELPDVVDVVAVVDAVALDAADAAVGDAPDVAVAVADAPDVQLADVVDAATDRPDVVDVPQDAGPVLYDLNAVRTGLEVRAVYRRVSSEGALDCEGAADMTSCFVSSNTLSFSLRACGRTFTGLVPLGTTTGRLVVVTPGAPRATNDFNPVVVAGTGVGARQGFRIGVSAPQDEATPGVTGIAGRTVDPMRGDIWLLGCEVR